MLVYAVGEKILNPLTNDFHTLFLDFQTGKFMAFDGRCMTQLTNNRNEAVRWLEDGNPTIELITLELTRTEK